MDSPYAREKMKEASGNGQKGPSLSELDMLIGDVLYFNHRVCGLVHVLTRLGYPGFEVSACGALPQVLFCRQPTKPGGWDVQPRTMTNVLRWYVGREGRVTLNAWQQHGIAFRDHTSF